MKHSIWMVVVLLFVFLLCPLHAQWVQTNGPFGGGIHALYKMGTTLLTGTDGAGLFRSLDNGTTWVRPLSGVSTTTNIYCFAQDGGTLWAGAWGSVLRSVDTGVRWESAGSGVSGFVQAIAVDRGRLLTGQLFSGVSLSVDSGKTWKDLTAGLKPWLALNIYSLAVTGDTIFSGTDTGVYRSPDFGVTWRQVTSTSLQNIGPTYALLVRENDMFAGNLFGVYRSTNRGDSWVQSDTGMPTWTSVYTFAEKDGKIFAGTDTGIFVTSDSGRHWSQIDPQVPTIIQTYALLHNGDDLLAGTWGQGIYRLSSGNPAWTLTHSGVLNSTPRRLVSCGRNMVACTNNGLFFSRDNGDNWISLEQFFPPNVTTAGFSETGGNLHAGVFNQVYRSLDSGKTWTAFGVPLPDGSKVYTLLVTSGAFFAGTNGKLYRSIDSGATWEICSGVTGEFNSLISAGNDIFTGSYSISTPLMYRSSDTGKTWVSVVSGLPTSGSIYALAASGSAIVTGTRDGIFRTTNRGGNWTNTSWGTTYALTAAGKNLYAAGNSGGVKLSIDNGTTWVTMNSGLLYNDISALATNDQFLFAGSSGGGAWRRPLPQITEVAGYKPPSVYPAEGLRITRQAGALLRVEVTIGCARHATIKCLDFSGRERAVLVDRRLPSGIHHFDWDTRTVAPGAYLMCMRTENGLITRYVVVSR